MRMLFEFWIALDADHIPALVGLEGADDRAGALTFFAADVAHETQSYLADQGVPAVLTIFNFGENRRVRAGSLHVRFSLVVEQKNLRRFRRLMEADTNLLAAEFLRMHAEEWAVDRLNDHGIPSQITRIEGGYSRW